MLYMYSLDEKVFEILQTKVISLFLGTPSAKSYHIHEVSVVQINQALLTASKFHQESWHPDQLPWNQLKNMYISRMKFLHNYKLLTGQSDDC